MDKLFHITIFTPEGIVHEGHISSLVAPGELGYLGVWAHHAPLMTTLQPGKIILKDAAGQQTIFESQSQGLLEVLKNEVILILDRVSKWLQPNSTDVGRIGKISLS